MYTLFIWTVVGTFAQPYAGAEKDWRPLAQFESQSLCEAGARQLGIIDRFRCVKTK
jgi:hypothetical protein